MLDRLPTELLTTIIRLAAPISLADHDPPSNAYLERRTTLKSCSLLSHRMRAVAQPMLPEVFEPVDENEVKAMCAAGANGQLVRDLTIGGRPRPAALAKVAFEHCKNPESLQLLQAGRIDFGWLDGMTRLTSLTVQDIVLCASPPPRLPSLVSLSLADVQIDLPSFSALLSHSNTPSLRHLALSSIQPLPDDPFTSPANLFLSALTPELLQRLEVLLLDSLDPFSPAIVFAPSIFIVVDVVLASGLETLLHQFPAQLPPHISLNFPTEDSVSTVVDEEADPEAAEDTATLLFALADRIAFPPTFAQRTVKLLVLPPFARTAYPPGGAIDSAVRHLVAVCGEKGVEVSWEEQVAGTGRSLFTASVVERARRMKIKQRGRAGTDVLE